MASNNPFALVVLTAKAAMQGKDLKGSEQRDELLLEVKLNVAKQLLIKKIPKDKIRVLMNFLKYYVRFENPDINAKFEKEVEFLTQKTNTMGIEELLLDRAEKRGLEKGKEEKSQAFVENLIVKMGLSDREAADLAEVSTDFVAKIRSGLNKKKI